ncbi:MAG: hypothetical protein MRJ68_16495 [Nitrospira sp.]|nr:hypothetical protein [Nitrospira sp.]
MNGREKVVAKNGPFSLVFCQIVALMFPHRSVVAGRLDWWLVAVVCPPCVTVSLSREEETPHSSQGKREAEAGTGGPERITQRK